MIKVAHNIQDQWKKAVNQYWFQNDWIKLGILKIVNSEGRKDLELGIIYEEIWRIKIYISVHTIQTEFKRIYNIQSIKYKGCWVLIQGDSKKSVTHYLAQYPNFSFEIQILDFSFKKIRFWEQIK